MTAQAFSINGIHNDIKLEDGEFKLFNLFKTTILDEARSCNMSKLLFTDQDKEKGTINLPKGMWNIKVDFNANFYGLNDNNVTRNNTIDFTLNAKPILNGETINGTPDFYTTSRRLRFYYKEEFTIIATKDTNTFGITCKPNFYKDEDNVGYPTYKFDFKKITISGYKIYDIA